LNSTPILRRLDSIIRRFIQGVSTPRVASATASGRKNALSAAGPQDEELSNKQGPCPSRKLVMAASARQEPSTDG
jgi:hypothetical protein